MPTPRPDTAPNRTPRELFQAIAKEPHRLGWLLGYKKLTPIHSKWIRNTFLATSDVTLMAHRGSFKTSAVTVVGTIWWLLFHPNDRVLICSSTDENAQKILSEIAEHYKHQPLRRLYRLLEVNEPRGGNWKNDSITLSTRKVVKKEGSVECVGSGGTVTSRHYDVIINDDLVTLKDRYSEATREQRKGWVRELQSIIEPDRHIIYAGTPWHKNDVYSILPPAMRFPLGAIPIPGLTEDRIKSIRRLQGESFFSAQYLLRHVPDENRLFDNPRFGVLPVDGNRNRVKLVVRGYLDPAFGGGDFCALAIGAVHKGEAYLLHGSVWQAPIDETYDRVIEICKRYEVRVLDVESNVAQRLVGKDLLRLGQPIRHVNQKDNKHLRIQSHIRQAWNKLTWCPGVEDEFMVQVLDYTEDAQNDDAPDALAGLLARLFRGATVKAGKGPLWG